MRFSMSKPASTTRTFPDSSPKWRVCCVREGISRTRISRPREAISAWEAALAADVPMRLSCERIVNAEVLRRMERNSQRSQDLVGRHLPALLRRAGNEFAGRAGLARSIATRNAENCRTGCIGSPRIEATSTPRCSPLP